MTPTPTTGQATRYDVLMDSIIHVDKLIDLGKRHAQKSGTLKPLPGDIDVLRAYAASAARDTYMKDFNPDHNPQDKLRVDEYDRVLKAVEEAELAEAHARGAFVAAERALAEAPAAGREPEVDWFLIASAIVVMTLSFAPTFHDRVFLDFEDVWATWFMSFVSGGFLAAFTTWMMTATISVVGRSGRWLNALGLMAGLGFGVAAGVLRWSIVESTEGRIMAIGMTLIEVSAVIYLEWVAIAMREKHQRWTVKHDAQLQLEATRDADKAHLQHRSRIIEQLKTTAGEHVRYVETRWIRHHKVDEIEKAAVDAVLSGYNEGVNENCGFTRGLRRVI